MRAILKLGLPLVALGLAGWAYVLGSQGRALEAFGAGIIALAALSIGAMMRNAMAGACVASLGGVGISAYLTLTKLVTEMPGYQAVCSGNDSFDCGAVTSSAWSEIAGLPTALWALAFYLALSLVSYKSWRKRPGYPLAGVFVFGCGITAASFSAFMAWQSSKLGTWCPFCVGLYGVSVLVLAGGFLAAREHGYLDAMGQVLRGQGDRSGGAALAVGVMVMLLGGSFVQVKTGEAAMEDLPISELYEAPEGSVSLGGHEPGFGHPNAEIVIVEWADYQCPHCAALSKPIKDMVSAYSPDIKLLHKHYPLHGDSSARLALAAICANQQGRFWVMNEILFSNSERTSREDLLFIAGEQLPLMGERLDMEKFTACLDGEGEDGERAGAALSQDIQSGQSAGVHGTPALLVNGLHPDGWIILKGQTDALAILLAARAEGLEFPPAQAHVH